MQDITDDERRSRLAHCSQFVLPVYLHFPNDSVAVDYTDKHVIPAEIGPEATQAALDAALAAHQALGCRGVSRSDFRYDDTQATGGGMGEMYWLEVNTQPGMTPLSLVPEQAAHLGISFPEICAWIVENAACDS